jgi:hypothetical protein
MVSQRGTSKLSAVQRMVRRLLLAELASYRVAGCFPKNRHFAEPTPFFVDDSGTRCAVAHLLELGGEGALVQRIARGRNNARVLELADEPRLTAWLDAAGLTLDEAALIQPSYCGEQDPGCLCNNRAAGHLEVTTTTYPRDGLATAVVKAIHGQVEPGIEVGSEIQVQSNYNEVPVELIVPGTPADQLSDGTPVYSGHEVTRGFSCGWSGTLSKEQYLQAVRASNCSETVRSFEEWIPEGCRDSGCGCRAVGEANPSAAGILMALLGAVIARRAARSSGRSGRPTRGAHEPADVG